MRRLTPRQERVLNYLRDFIDEHGYPPSYRQIAQACQISSTSVVDYNLEVLEREGYLRRDRDISRGIELTGPAGRPRVVKVPILGQIGAGHTIQQHDAESFEKADEIIEVDECTINDR